MTAEAVRRALIVSRAEEPAECLALANRAGWDLQHVTGFSHAGFLLAMNTFAAVVVIENHPGTELLDGLGWLRRQLHAPVVVVTPFDELIVLGALSLGALWVPPEPIASCPDFLRTLLEQADALGQQHRRASQAETILRDREARIERLLGMLWEATPVEGPPRWFTQRHMLERLEEEVERSRRSGTPLSVVLCEMTGQPGKPLPKHHADRLASWLADEVARRKRRIDVTGHYGPHGFMMVLPQTTQAQAIKACRRLSQTLPHPPHTNHASAHVCFALAGGESGPVTLPGLLRCAEERLDRVRETGLAIIAE